MLSGDRLDQVRKASFALAGGDCHSVVATGVARNRATVSQPLPATSLYSIVSVKDHNSFQNGSSIRRARKSLSPSPAMRAEVWGEVERYKRRCCECQGADGRPVPRAVERR